MKKVSRNKVMIDKPTRQEAWRRARRMKGAPENHYQGYLGELVAARYLGIEWNDPGYSQRDLVDGYGTTYQVKTVRENPKKLRLWCEKDTSKKFDRYIFVVLDENDSFGEVVGELTKEVAEANSHEFRAELPRALWRVCPTVVTDEN